MQMQLMGKPADVRFGSKADICIAKSHVRFAPNSDRESEFLQRVMSALPPKADMCSAAVHVRFGPKADIPHSFDQLVGELQERVTNRQAERLGRFKIDDEFELVR
jgi:hypothetical protein